MNIVRYKMYWKCSSQSANSGSRMYGFESIAVDYEYSAHYCKLCALLDWCPKVLRVDVHTTLHDTTLRVPAIPSDSCIAHFKAKRSRGSAAMERERSGPPLRLRCAVQTQSGRPLASSHLMTSGISSEMRRSYLRYGKQSGNLSHRISQFWIHNTLINHSAAAAADCRGVKSVLIYFDRIVATSMRTHCNSTQHYGSIFERRAYLKWTELTPFVAVLW